MCNQGGESQSYLFALTLAGRFTIRGQELSVELEQNSVHLAGGLRGCPARVCFPRKAHGFPLRQRKGQAVAELWRPSLYAELELRDFKAKDVG